MIKTVTPQIMHYEDLNQDQELDNLLNNEDHND